MSLESAIMELAQAIRSLANTANSNEVREAVEVLQNPAVAQDLLRPVCMDAAGVPTSFKRRCGICGELGRYRASHKDEMRDGTYHWIEVKA